MKREHQASSAIPRSRRNGHRNVRPRVEHPPQAATEFPSILFGLDLFDQEAHKFHLTSTPAEDALVLLNAKKRLQSKLASVQQNLKSIQSLDDEISNTRACALDWNASDLEALWAMKRWHEEHNRKLVQEAQRDYSFVLKLEQASAAPCS